MIIKKLAALKLKFQAVNNFLQSNGGSMKLNNYILAFAVLSLLSSCGGEALSFKLASASIVAASNGFFSRTDVNLKEKNYAAADYLVGKIQPHINETQLILAVPLEEADHAGISSPLGSSIPEGIALRMIELGYNVNLHEVAPSHDVALYPALPKNVAPDFILKGTYLPNSKDVDVFLRFIDVKSSRVIARFDYSLLLSREVRELSQTETRIFKVSK